MNAAFVNRLTSCRAQTLAVLWLFSSPCAFASATSDALTQAVRGTQAAGIVLDLKTGAVIARVGREVRATPGSTIKPLLLEYALEHGVISGGAQVFCDRHLRIAGRTVDCTHPADRNVFNAESALAESCNRYFAELGRRFTGPALEQALRESRLKHLPIEGASTEERELTALGLENVTATPIALAESYRELMLRPPAGGPVERGLLESVDYGMAHPAAVQGVSILGKTGTARNPGEGLDTRLVCRRAARSNGRCDLCPAWRWWNSGEPGRTVLPRYPQGGSTPMRAHSAAALAMVLFFACRPFVTKAQQAVTSQDGGKEVSVALFSATRVKAATLTPLSATAWTALCPTCEHRSLAAPRTFAGPGELFAGGALLVTDSVSGAQRSAVGLWHLKAIAGTLDVVLTLPSERYVAAVLSAETGANEPAESLRAMAIVARTYALNGSHYAAPAGHLKADLCDSTECQAARFGALPDAIEEAIWETAGATLWSGRKRAEVYFSQSCGGTTEDAGAAWPSADSMRSTPYPGQHPDPYCLRRGVSAWHTEINLTDLQSIAAAQGWRVPSEIASVEIVKRSAAHRALLLQFAGRSGIRVPVSASALRLAIGRALGWNKVRSDWYDVGVRNGELIFDGRGFGHGVGLCQQGATEMAAERKSSQEILAFYFPGIREGIGPDDGGWSIEHLSGVDVRGVRQLTPSQREDIEGAWRQAEILFPPRTPIAPEIVFAPSVELFRQMTSQPGWMLASTRGSRIVINARPMLDLRKQGTLRHEMLHALVESEASTKAPLWLREGLVEFLDNEAAGSTMSAAAMEAELSHPTTREASQQAHRAAARKVRPLILRYGMARVRSWLVSGVPSGAN